MKYRVTLFACAAACLAAACSQATGVAANTGNAVAGANPQAAAQPAGGVDDPVAYVRQRYGPGGPDAGSSTATSNAQDPVYSPRLRALFADDERYAGGEVGRLEFSPYTGAQDDDIRQATVTSSDVDGAPDRRVVSAAFTNMGKPTRIHFYFERIGGRWFVDDISSPGYGEAEGPGAWTLSLILRYGHH